MRKARGDNRNTRLYKRLLLEILAGCVVLAALTLAITNAERGSPPISEPFAPGTSGPPAETSEQATETSIQTTGTTAPPTEATTPPEATQPPDIPAVAGAKKLIALTFDDGPHPALTPRLLDFLREQDVRVTFFVIGVNVNDAPGVLRRAAAEGHQIGNHTYHHKDLVKLSPERRRAEIEDNAALIESITGTRPTTLRPPFGTQSDALQAAVDTPLIYWSIDPADWSTRDADKTYRHVMERAKDGDIILLHDWYPETIAAAERLVPALKAQGFVFVTVDQLLAARGEAKAGEMVRKRPPAQKE